MWCIKALKNKHKICETYRNPWKTSHTAIKTFSSNHLTLIDRRAIKWTSFVAPKALFILTAITGIQDNKKTHNLINISLSTLFLVSGKLFKPTRKSQNLLQAISKRFVRH